MHPSIWHTLKTLLAAIILVSVISGCYTLRGVNRDIRHTGDHIEHTIRR